jgi:imidazolonepropionase-like amidohydrolase
MFVQFDRSVAHFSGASSVMRTRRVSLALLLPILIATAACESMPRESTLALVGGRLIDGSGAPAIEDGVVVMRGKRIVAVGPRSETSLPAHATIIDVGGKTIMPGMIEGNGHIMFSGQSNHAFYFPARAHEFYTIGARNLYTSLQQGITTMRDTMDPLEEMLALRADVESGKVAGSRLFTSGTILNYPGVYRLFEEASADTLPLTLDQLQRARDAVVLPVWDGAHGREIVAGYASRGVDFIKVSAYSGPDNEPPVLSTEALREIVEESHARGLRVTTHTESVASVVSVLDAGVDAMEHPQIMATHLAQGEAEFTDALAKRFADERVYSVPLVMVSEVYLTYYEDPDRLDDPRFVRHAPADMVQEGRESVRGDLRRDPNLIRDWRARVATGRRNLAKLIEAGAPIAMGTDKGSRLNFHESGNHVRELEIYVELGMTPMEAIVSATRRGAELLGREDEFGTLEVGKLADVIVIDGNPLDGITVLHNVEIVFKEGVQYR